MRSGQRDVCLHAELVRRVLRDRRRLRCRKQSVFVGLRRRGQRLRAMCRRAGVQRRRLLLRRSGLQRVLFGDRVVCDDDLERAVRQRRWHLRDLRKRADVQRTGRMRVQRHVVPERVLQQRGPVRGVEQHDLRNRRGCLYPVRQRSGVQQPGQMHLQCDIVSGRMLRQHWDRLHPVRESRARSMRDGRQHVWCMRARPALQRDRTMRLRWDVVPGLLRFEPALPYLREHNVRRQRRGVQPVRHRARV